MSGVVGRIILKDIQSMLKTHQIYSLIADHRFSETRISLLETETRGNTGLKLDYAISLINSLNKYIPILLYRSKSNCSFLSLTEKSNLTEK